MPKIKARGVTASRLGRLERERQGEGGSTLLPHYCPRARQRPPSWLRARTAGHASKRRPVWRGNDRGKTDGAAAGRDATQMGATASSHPHASLLRSIGASALHQILFHFTMLGGAWTIGDDALRTPSRPRTLLPPSSLNAATELLHINPHKAAPDPSHSKAAHAFART